MNSSGCWQRKVGGVCATIAVRQVAHGTCATGDSSMVAFRDKVFYFAKTHTMIIDSKTGKLGMYLFDEAVDKAQNWRS